MSSNLREQLDQFIRDLTKVHPLPKSEIRRRLEDLLHRPRATGQKTEDKTVKQILQDLGPRMNGTEKGYSGLTLDEALDSIYEVISGVMNEEQQEALKTVMGRDDE